MRNATNIADMARAFFSCSSGFPPYLLRPTNAKQTTPMAAARPMTPLSISVIFMLPTSDIALAVVYKTIAKAAAEDMRDDQGRPDRIYIAAVITPIAIAIPAKPLAPPLASLAAPAIMNINATTAAPPLRRVLVSMLPRILIDGIRSSNAKDMPRNAPRAPLASPAVLAAFAIASMNIKTAAPPLTRV